MNETAVKRRFSVILPAVLALAILSGCGRKEPVAKNAAAGGAEKKETTPRMENFSLSGYDQGGKEAWQMTGQTAAMLGTSDVEIQQLWSRHQGEAQNLTLTADRGLYRKAENVLHVQDNVVAVTDDGARLTTDSLNWSTDKSTIWGEDPCRLEKEKITAFGTGIETRTDLARAELKQDVEVRIEPETVITCDGPLEIHYEKNLAIFQNHVRVKNLQGEILADRVEVFMEPPAKGINRIVAAGNVTVVNRNYRVSGERAVYNAADGRVVFEGKPKALIYSAGKVMESAGGK